MKKGGGTGSIDRDLSIVTHLLPLTSCRECLLLLVCCCDLLLLRNKNIGSSRGFHVSCNAVPAYTALPTPLGILSLLLAL